jgi:cysteinyl-tRNA synthetase, unknown class
MTHPLDDIFHFVKKTKMRLIMATADNGIYVLQGIVPAQIAAAPVRIKGIDLYNDDGQLFSAAQVAIMKGGSVPSTLLGYFSIGEAENYRPYWSSLPSSALGPVDPNWPGDYQVAYWTTAWKAVSTNYIDQMNSLGYQGAYFDVVDVCETAWAKSHAPNGDAKGAMTTLIESLSAYAHAKAPGFKIWINSSGAEDLLTNQAFVNSIDGAFEEELFYKDSGSPQSSADVSYNLNLLNNLVTAGKDVIAIEYVTGSATVKDVQAKAAAAGIGSYVANPDLELNGVDTEGFASLPSSGSGSGSPLTSGPQAITLTGTNPSVTITKDAVVTCNASTDTITVTAGNVTVNGAAGGTMKFIEKGPGTVIINAKGNDTITLGAGVATINIIKDSSADVLKIYGFKLDVDHLHQVGYSTRSDWSGVSAKADTTAGLQLTYRDGTQIILDGIHSARYSQIFN